MPFPNAKGSKPCSLTRQIVASFLSIALLMILWAVCCPHYLREIAEAELIADALADLGVNLISESCLLLNIIDQMEKLFMKGFML